MISFFAIKQSKFRYCHLSRAADRRRSNRSVYPILQTWNGLEKQLAELRIHYQIDQRIAQRCDVEQKKLHVPLPVRWGQTDRPIGCAVPEINVRQSVESADQRCLNQHFYFFAPVCGRCSENKESDLNENYYI